MLNIAVSVDAPHVELTYISLDLALLCSFNNSLDGFLWNSGFKAFNLFGMEYWDRSDDLTFKFPHYGLVCYRVFHLKFWDCKCL